MYNKQYKKKVLSVKGHIESIEVSDLIKNDWVGAQQKDYYIHTISIKDDEGKVSKFQLRQISDEKKFDEGTYVTFRYNHRKEFKHPLIESKSYAKTYTQEEMQAMMNNDSKPKAPVQKQNKRSGYRRN